MEFPFWILVPIVGIIGWAVVTISTARARQYSSSSELAKRVDELERRVSSLERGA